MTIVSLEASRWKLFQQIKMENSKQQMELEIYWVDPYLTVHQTVWLQILVSIVLVLVLVIGIAMNLGIMVYERFGEDPQKRSIQNQASVDTIWPI